MNKRVFLLLFGFIFFVSSGLKAEDRGLLRLSPNDRILVVAPHPDDETIGAAGVIQEALRQNIPVRVMYMTNGDSNSLAFLYYKKYPVLSGKQALDLGRLRQQESVEAARLLGLKDDELVFLGYPDYGTLRIFKNYWDPSRLYRGTLTNAQHVPYSGTLSPGSGYHALSILEDLKKTLLDLRPTVVFVTHPGDMNEDHQAAYLFLKVALWDLKGQLGEVALYTYFIHAVDWPRPVGLFPERRMEYLPHLGFRENQWSHFELTADQIKRKEQTIGSYRTQIPYKPNFLYSFVRVNEPFASVSAIGLKTVVPDPNVWAQLETEQSTCLAGGCISDRRARYLRSVVYALTKDSLEVRVRTNRLNGDFKFSLNVFGYREDVAFAEMPKLRVEMDRAWHPAVMDGREYVRRSGVKISRIGNDIFVELPLNALGRPQKVLGSVTLWSDSLPIESSAWSVAELEYGS